MNANEERSDVAKVQLLPWGDGDLWLLERCLSDPVMMKHLGGPETPAKIAERQARYEKPNSKQFKILCGATDGVGWVGYWESEWRGEPTYEIGWSVISAFQGRGIAAAATAQALAIARGKADRRFVYAFPAVGNGPSNAICRKVGFTLVGPCEFEYPKGSLMQCNEWCFDLRMPEECLGSGHMSQVIGPS